MTEATTFYLLKVVFRHTVFLSILKMHANACYFHASEFIIIIISAIVGFVKSLYILYTSVVLPKS